WSGNRIKQLTCEEVEELVVDEYLALAITSNLNIITCLSEQIRKLEKVIKGQVKLKSAFEPLRSVPGIGD
ncbi:hypothetical protein, partial [Methylobacterium frigidaeris]|uniref:hypothetical protein n=1 Tax=Methylobacterium frigidaeris TaxID=2038277 RepID=UPI001EE00D16